MSDAALAGSLARGAARLAGEPLTAQPVAPEALPALLAGLEPATPFQTSRWLSAWYATAGRQEGVEPLPVAVADRAGRLVALLPLVRRREGGLAVIAFADGGITDYNAPVLAPGAIVEPGALWRALRAVLPRADIIDLQKMPSRLGAAANPLALLPGARSARLCGNIIRLGDDFETYHRGHERTFRKELERCWRVFSRHAGAEFRLVRAMDEAETILAALEAQQRARIEGLALRYELDLPGNAAHYRALVREGLADGSVVLSALLAQGQVVAALLGLRHGDHYAMVRISTAGHEWRTCSPGRLVIERTMRALHADGIRTIDFTIGSYDYKRRMGVDPVPLVDCAAAASLRGALVLGFRAARRRLAGSPLLRRLRARLQAAAASASARSSND